MFARGDSCADVFKRRAMKALGSKISRHELEGTEGGEGEITGRRSQFRLMLDNKRQIYNEIFRMNDWRARRGQSFEFYWARALAGWRQNMGARLIGMITSYMLHTTPPPVVGWATRTQIVSSRRNQIRRLPAVP